MNGGNCNTVLDVFFFFWGFLCMYIGIYTNFMARQISCCCISDCRYPLALLVWALFVAFFPLWGCGVFTIWDLVYSLQSFHILFWCIGFEQYEKVKQLQVNCNLSRGPSFFL